MKILQFVLKVVGNLAVPLVESNSCEMEKDLFSKEIIHFLP